MPKKAIIIPAILPRVGFSFNKSDDIITDKISDTPWLRGYITIESRWLAASVLKKEFKNRQRDIIIKYLIIFLSRIELSFFLTLFLFESRYAVSKPSVAKT